MKRDRLSLSGKAVLVVGFGRSGQAALRLLAASGARVVVTDQKPAEAFGETAFAGSADVRFHWGGFRSADFEEADLIVLSPGVPRSQPLVAAAVGAGTPVIAEVELAYRLSAGTFIGVSGSNGKTTTTTLLGRMLASVLPTSQTAGNIGRPLSDAVAGALPDAGVTYVVELSSFQLESVSRFCCQVALLLNVTPDHLDRYPDFTAYREAKRRIFRNQTRTDFAVWNADEPDTQPPEDSRATPFPFSRLRPPEHGIGLEDGWITARLAGRRSPICPLDSVRLPGAHNLENVLAASAGAFLSRVPPTAIRAAIERFRGVEHRMEPVARIDGVEYYNDSKATNVDAALKALESFSSPIIAILGGSDKGSDFTGLTAALARRVKQVIVIGAVAPKILAVVPPEVPAIRSETLESAVAAARRLSTPGDVVLLAPACASFDMFRNFEHRGEVFKAAVRALQRSETCDPQEVRK